MSAEPSTSSDETMAVNSTFKRPTLDVGGTIAKKRAGTLTLGAISRPSDGNAVATKDSEIVHPIMTHEENREESEGKKTLFFSSDILQKSGGGVKRRSR